MGKVFSVIRRKINRFNVENRAQKILAKKQPMPAPKHDSTLKQFEEIKTGLSNLPQTELERDVGLHNKLKEVYVRSTDPHVEMPQSGSSRPLPLERHAARVPVLGLEEQSMIPHGRCSLQQALKFISNHQEDPVRWKYEVIAEEYKLQPETVEKVLRYYKMFQVFVPTGKDEKKVSMFSLPPELRKQLTAAKEDGQAKPQVSETPINK